MASIDCVAFGATLILFFLRDVYGSSIDVSKTRIWGPGLYPERIVLPARYFFIRAVDENNVRCVAGNFELLSCLYAIIVLLAPFLFTFWFMP